MKNFTERFQEMLDFIGLTPYRLAIDIDSSDVIISRIKNGKTKPSFDFLSKLVDKYPVVNTNYLLTGQGKLLHEKGITGTSIATNDGDMAQKEGKNTPESGQKLHKKLHPTLHPTVINPNKKGIYQQFSEPQMVSEPEVYRTLGMPKVITVNERNEENIIYVPVKARAGYLTGYGDAEYIATLPSYRLPGLDNATYRMFEVEGPSMAPNILSGDRVIGQWLSDLSEIRENRVHVVVTKNGVVVKRILNRISTRGKIVLKSDTVHHRKEFPSFDLDPAEIIEIWYCRLKLSADFAEPSEIYTRLNDLEAEMTDKNAEIADIKYNIDIIIKQLSTPPQ